MRIAVVFVFFVTFASVSWFMRHRAAADVEPRDAVVDGASRPSGGAEVAPTQRDLDEIACVNMRANDPQLPRAEQAAAVHKLFTKYLRPPTDATRVSAVLTDPRWVSRASFSEFTVVLGWAPIGLSGYGREVFLLELCDTRGDRMARLLIRVSGLPGATPGDLADFLRGGGGRPAALRIEELAWQHLTDPSAWEVEHYTPGRVVHYK